VCFPDIGTRVIKSKLNLETLRNATNVTTRHSVGPVILFIAHQPSGRGFSRHGNGFQVRVLLPRFSSRRVLGHRNENERHRRSEWVGHFQ
jgi:hypothetical protein